MKPTSCAPAWLVQFAMMGSVGLAALAPHSVAWGQSAAAAPKTYDIPAGPLEDALNHFARQAGITLSFDPALVKDSSSAPLRGQHDVQGGLDALLGHSTLQAVRADNGSYSLRPRPPGKVSNTAPVHLPEITVKGVARRSANAEESATGPVSGYVARRSATGTKTDTPLIETAQSISVIGRDELIDRGVTSIVQALEYVPGVMTSQNGHDDRNVEWFNIRGFGSAHTANYLDGLRQMSSTYTVAQSEPYGLERIEILRGPSSTLYGQGDVGGVINRVSKRPLANAVNELEVQVGNFGRKQLGADVGGTFAPQGELAFRLVGLAMDTQPQADYPGYDERHARRTYLAPSLAWRPSAATSIVLLADAARIRSGNNPVEYLGPDRQRTGVLGYEPAYDLFDQKQWNLGYQAEHHFNETWTVRQNLRTSDTDMHLHAVLSEGKVPDGAGNITRDVLARTESVSYTTLDNQLQGRLSWGRTEHLLLVGMDWTRSAVHGQLFYDPDAGPVLNVNQPVYGQPVLNAPPLLLESRQVLQQLGFYVQDQVKIGPHWRLTAGLRHDRAKTDDHNLLADTFVTLKDSATTGRLGATFLTDAGFAPYASYTESFLPTPTDYGLNYNNEPYKPTEGKQVELGVKFQSRDGKAFATAAVFDMDKTNVVTWGVLGGTQIGAVRSRGLELELKQQITAGLDISAQYTHLDTKVTSSLTNNLGKQMPGAPNNLASAWLNYRVPGGDWRGLGFGLGARYTDRRYDDEANLFETPAYTLFDAALSYDTGPWALAFNVHNLFDKDHTGNASGYYRGSRRTAVLSARYRF